MEVESFGRFHFFLPLFLHECLLHLGLLFFPDFHHHFLHPTAHFFLVLLLAGSLAVGPWVFPQTVEGDAFFGIRC